jgi:hypothetical protein
MSFFGLLVCFEQDEFELVSAVADDFTAIHKLWRIGMETESRWLAVLSLLLFLSEFQVSRPALWLQRIQDLLSTYGLCLPLSWIFWQACSRKPSCLPMFPSCRSTFLAVACFPGDRLPPALSPGMSEQCRLCWWLRTRGYEP